jgi:hypothetical protein
VDFKYSCVICKVLRLTLAKNFHLAQDQTVALVSAVLDEYVLDGRDCVAFQDSRLATDQPPLADGCTCAIFSWREGARIVVRVTHKKMGRRSG